jgi:transposase
VIADKGDEAEARVLAPLREAGQTAVIPPKRNRKEQRAYDRDRYEARHLLENFFGTLKQDRAMATRDDKTARDFLAAVSLAATVILLNCGHALVLQRDLVPHACYPGGTGGSRWRSPCAPPP